MPHSITCCPKCNTSFRVTSSQLESADGAVRCGSCLHVFDARSYFVNSSDADDSTASESPAETTVAGPVTLTNDPDSDDFLISDDMDLPGQETHPDDDLNLDFSDQSLFDDNRPKDGINLGELSPEFRDQESNFSSKPDAAPQSTTESESDSDIDESWAHELLEELDADLAEADEDPSARLQREIDNRFDGRQTGSFDVLQEEFDADFDKFVNEAPIEDKPALAQDTGKFDFTDYRNSKMSEQIAQATQATRNHVPNPAYSITQSFEPVPLELTYQANNTRTWLTRAGWLIANLVLILALVVQIGYLKFDSWSRIEPYRQYYAMACPMFNCTLPAQDAYEKIKISLVVRADPDNADVLQADAILVNTAKFNQPFPPLALRFSDYNDRVIAERVFLPNEYLQGELAGASEIPPNQPVQLSLKLADPGELAVNYRAYIPAQQ